MSFLIDPPWLYANGRAYAAVAPGAAQGDVAKIAGAGLMAVFWGVSVSLYLDRPWTRRMMRSLPGEDGRDFMVNSGVLNLDHRSSPRKADAVSAAIFATYPFWLWLGYRHGRRHG